jgi:hypothetical protein
MIQTRGYEYQQEAEQNATGLPGAPTCAIEDAMVVLKMRLFAQPDRAQTGRDSTLAPRQQRAAQQNLGVFPHGLGKERLENYNQVQQFGRQCVHRKSSFGEEISACLCSLPLFFSKN